MKFKIFEGNMERLEKKLNRIKRKCEKYGNYFLYEKLGEEFVEVEDERHNKRIVKYIVVNVEGKAIINNWQFVGVIEHTDNGNIIKKCCDIEVPEKYYTTDTSCEHCNSHRRRKFTYLVYNIVTGDFKQVGKTCLKDFTNGMSAESVAEYISCFDTLIQGETIDNLHSYPQYYVETQIVLQYAAETVRHFGYVKSGNADSTRNMTEKFYYIDNNIPIGVDEKYIKELMQKVNFNYKSNYAVNLSAKALEWLKKQQVINNYMNNLRVVCETPYITFNNIGILVSLIPTYTRAIETENERIQQIQQQRKQKLISQHVGNIKDRITITVIDTKKITSWLTEFGMTYVYKFTDENKNIYTWKTTKCINNVNQLIGTVKAHNEFNSVKQTELTRCKVIA